MQGLNSKKRGNLRRRQKRADSMGGVTLDRVNRPVDRSTLSRYVDRDFRLYERSWKPADGVPIQEYHRRFYAEVAERFTARSMLDLSILQVGGRDAAFIMGLRERDTFYDVTISYDEEFASVSPGMILIQEVARRCAAEGVRLLVSHGDRDYTRAWASGCFLSLFIDSITVMLFLATVTVELARLLKFDPVPVIIAEIFASNTGGSATMSGDPPNIIIGTHFNYTFADFAANTGPIAWISMIVVVVLFYFFFRKALTKQAADNPPKSPDQYLSQERPSTIAASSF